MEKRDKQKLPQADGTGLEGGSEASPGRPESNAECVGGTSSARPPHCVHAPRNSPMTHASLTGSFREATSQQSANQPRETQVLPWCCQSHPRDAQLAMPSKTLTRPSVSTSPDNPAHTSPYRLLVLTLTQPPLLAHLPPWAPAFCISKASSHYSASLKGPAGVPGIQQRTPPEQSSCQLLVWLTNTLQPQQPAYRFFLFFFWPQLQLILLSQRAENAQNLREPLLTCCKVLL